MLDVMHTRAGVRRRSLLLLVKAGGRSRTPQRAARSGLQIAGQRFQMRADEVGVKTLF